MKAFVTTTLGLLVASVLACGDPPRPEAPPCDQTCKDAVALRAVREGVKLAYNLLLQGKPVGSYDVVSPCIRGGLVRIVGTATSNPVQGATEVDLTYIFGNCSILERDEDADENYELAFSGRLTQKGIIAVQPTATTALLFKSEDIDILGNVYAPALPFEEINCNLDVLQNGNTLAGTFCGRTVGLDL